MGTGSIPGTGGWSANALWVIGGSRTRPSQPAWVAWPPQGYVPYQVLPKRSGRWSFAYAGAGFGNAKVYMTQDGTNVPVTLENQNNDRGYADNTLVWKPQGVSALKPATDVACTVTISNVVVGTTSRSFSYSVTIIDPDAVVEVPPVLAVRKSATGGLSLAWPAASTGFVVQSSSPLVTPPQWSNVPGTPVRQGNEFRLEFTAPPQGQQFFRLSR
jgi:hypothetical protein